MVKAPFAAPPGRVLLRVPRGRMAVRPVGVALFAIVVYAGLAGEQNFTSNLAPTFIYVIFWVGIPIASAFVGDIFRPFNPWRALGRLTGWLLHRAGYRRGPLLGSYPRGWVAGRQRRRCSPSPGWSSSTRARTTRRCSRS